MLLKVIPLVSLFVSAVLAQSDGAVCLAGYEWNQNSLGQDPCTIGGKLGSFCRGYPVYYPQLPNNQTYYIPSGPNGTECDCNTVMYSLIMSCVSCQGGAIYPWPPWSQDCGYVYVGQYPTNISQETTVPRWAFYDVTKSTNQTYNDTVASLIGRDPEETPKPIPVITLTSATLPGQSTIVQPISTNVSDGPHDVDSEGGKTNVGAIIGGVVGSVVPLTIISVVVFFYMRNRRQKQAQQQYPSSEKNTLEYAPPMHSVPFTSHNPVHPSPFLPQHPVGSVMYVTPSQNARGRHYPGIPEV